MRALITATAFFFASVSSASAGWEFTEWGMTLDEVLESSDRKIQEYSQEETNSKSTFEGHSCLAYLENYEVGNFDFEVRFCFDSQDTLSSVQLYTDDEKFEELERTLIYQFGAPVYRGDSTIGVGRQGMGLRVTSRIWRDENAGHIIRLLGGTSTIIQYRPISEDF